MFLMPSTCAQRMPIVMKSCGMMPRAPLRFLGESSPRYIGTTLEERPAVREGCWDEINFYSCLTHNKWLKIKKNPTCTYAHYKPGNNDDLEGLSDLTDPHHHGRDDGEDVVEEEGALPIAGLKQIK